MSLKEKFITNLLPEPQKTFRKLNIVDGDNLLTEEGAKVFLTWLLNQHKEEFNKDVARPLLKETEKK